MIERPGTPSVPHGPNSANPELVLAYAADDGSFALYNDYSTGHETIRPGTDTEAFRDVVATWRRTRDAGRLRPAAPVETVEGYGVFTFPYGPISMGVPESGRFDLRTYGERILTVSPIAGYKSRRILSSVHGQTVPDAVLRIERLAGNFSAAHVAAFLSAAESATGARVPREELWVRALAQELQRIYNHIRAVARVAEAASQNVGAAQAHALAEETLRVQGSIFGHRWLFGALLPSGPRRRLGPADRRALGATLKRTAEAFERLWELFLGSRTFVDRIQSTCVVSPSLAKKWGAVGPTLRACGIPWDDRLRVPRPPYTDLFLDLPQESSGDALARLFVRAREIRASFLLLEQLLDRWPATSAAPEAPPPPIAPSRGVGRVESPSGDLVYDVTISGDRVASVGMRSASQANFPLFALGLREGVFTDFHFAWESFGLVFAEVDG